MDVDTRLLRYFAAVSAEGNLTRAARLLFVSQPALTKQIRQLERELGAALFIRSHDGMTLTAAGQALAERVPDLLGELDCAVGAAKSAASRAAHVLRVGFLASAANEATQEILADFAAARPRWTVDMRASSWVDPSAGLADNESDVAFVRLPFPGQDRFRIEVLLTEPRLVAVAASHRLASRDSVSLEDLLDEPFVAAPAETGDWRDWWLATDQRHGHPVRIGVVTETGQPDDWLTAIASGRGIAFAPESATRYYARTDIVYRPVDGLSPSQVGIGWADPCDTVIADFVRCCLNHRQTGAGSGSAPSTIADADQR